MGQGVKLQKFGWLTITNQSIINHLFLSQGDIWLIQTHTRTHTDYTTRIFNSFNNIHHHIFIIAKLIVTHTLERGRHSVLTSK